MSFRASKSGLGYEVQRKLELVRLRTSCLSISYILYIDK
jgi:hypothetical protein